MRLVGNSPGEDDAQWHSFMMREAGPGARHDKLSARATEAK
jgi:hypothetical protein